jgi:L-ascorbate metabolism protein UlaG (beta-lactamase superfamily)
LKVTLFRSLEMKKALLLIVASFVVGGGWLAWRLNARPSIEQYAAIAMPAATDDAGLRVTFLGVATLVLRDSSAAILIDGFFSRPGKLATATGKIGPDHARIDAALKRAGIEKLDAVITVHSHYDHAMDSPAVAARTGAVVVGSQSTAYVARGQSFPEERIRVVTSAETMKFGDLEVTLIPSRHFPHGQAMGELTAPLVPPARALDYLEGGSFSVFVQRHGNAVLVQGSAGYVEGALRGRHADVVYLGVGLLGSKDEGYRDSYWRETVQAVGAKRVVPIHWDDFTLPLTEPLVALPWFFDDLDKSMKYVSARAAREAVDLRWPVPWQKTDPFAGLEDAK